MEMEKRRVKLFLTALAAMVILAALLAGCGDSNPQAARDSDIWGDWLLVAMNGKPYPRNPSNPKVVYSFSSDDSTATSREFHNYRDFWIESPKTADFSLKTSLPDMRISGDTLILNMVILELRLVRADLAAVKRSLGTVYSQDTALFATNWVNPPESNNMCDMIIFTSKFGNSGEHYIADNNYYDDVVWYTENTSLFLLGLTCREWEGFDDIFGNPDSVCVSPDIAETVVLEYAVARPGAGVKTLKVRPAGSGDWDDWTLFDANGNSIHFQYPCPGPGPGPGVSKQSRRP